MAEAHQAPEERDDFHADLYQAVLRTTVDPIIVIDSSGIIQKANLATERLLGHREADMLGRNVSMLMPEPFRSEHDGYLERYLKTGEPRIIGIGREIEAQRADGTTFPMSLAVSEVDGPGDRYFTGVLHDLTERDEAARQLEEANQNLEQRVVARTADLEASMLELARSNRDLEQFAYIASHDLQAPLRNVRQGLELLDEHLLSTMGIPFDGEANELRELIVHAVGTMEDLIRGLLSYSRLQRSEDPTNTPVDLAELAAEVVSAASMDIAEIGGTVDIGDLPVVQGDRTQLSQLIQNLLQNALKYRHDDRVPRIVMTSEPIDGGIVVSVADNGIGVDEEQHERIFELFRRGHPGYAGVGLGLAICQRIVERHNGSIWVTSTPGEGATFSFRLPKSEEPT
ncbi:MAG: sensor histidine kinase [Acidimicrobiales bacterium]